MRDILVSISVRSMADVFQKTGYAISYSFHVVVLHCCSILSLMFEPDYIREANGFTCCICLVRGANNFLNWYVSEKKPGTS